MPPPSYTVHRVPSPPNLYDVFSPSWEKIPCIQSFDHLAPSSAPLPETRVKLSYDDHAIYIAAFLHEQHVWATITENNSIIFMDNDFEIFLDPDANGLNYYEFEINPLGTTWQLSLDRPYSQSGTATSPHELPGLRSTVRVYGTLNDPTDVDRGWSVGVAIPFEDLRQFGSNVPPQPGDTWRANFSRVQWDHEIVDNKYVRVPPHGTPLPQGANQWHPEHNIVWAPTGVVDIHRPQHWGSLKFA